MTSHEEELKPAIRKASRSVAYQWPGIVEKDDVEQSIWAHLLERAGTVAKLMKMDDKARYRAIVGIGHQIASQERTDYDHYKGSYTYAVKEVKDLLARGVLTERVDGFDAAVLDLIDGLEKLVVKTPQYVEAIVSRYADNESPASKSVEHALSRGLESLARAMNQSARVRFSERDDGIGTRHPVSGEGAQYLSSSEYDGGYALLPAESRDSGTEPEVWEQGKWK